MTDKHKETVETDFEPIAVATQQIMERVAPNRTPAPVDAGHSDTTAIIQVIERAAMNPSVDIDKMERLLQMQERIHNRAAHAAYVTAFAEMQTELPSIVERGEGHSSTYAKWEDINEAIKPVLSKHGFGLSFRSACVDTGIQITAVLAHCDGHSEETSYTFPADTSGSKNAIQAVGSSMSYGKRYTASAILNLVSHGEDDDGSAAANGGPISDEQFAKLNAEAERVGADKAKFCNYLKITALSDLPASRFDAAMTELRIFGEKRGVKADD